MCTAIGEKSGDGGKCACPQSCVMAHCGSPTEVWRRMRLTMMSVWVGGVATDASDDDERLGGVGWRRMCLGVIMGCPRTAHSVGVQLGSAARCGMSQLWGSDWGVATDVSDGRDRGSSCGAIVRG
jgi:hypothetical protein